MEKSSSLGSDGRPAEPDRLRGSFPLFRVGGILVRADPSWLFLFAIVLLSLAIGYFPGTVPGQAPATYGLAASLTTLLFFASLLVHELSHALVAIRAGLEVPRITLFLFGGVSEMQEEPPTPSIELRVALVGPLTSGVLALGFWGLARIAPAEPWYLSAIPLYLAWINLALGIFNLLPGYPLDGGRVLRALVWRRTGSLRQATEVASGAGKAFGVGLVALGALEIFLGGLFGGFWLILIGLFLRSLAGQGYRNLLMRRALAGATVAEAMIPAAELVAVPPDATLSELVDGYFLRHGHRGFPVVEHGRALGLVGLEAVRRVDRRAWDSTRVRDVMEPAGDRLRVAPEAPLNDALNKISPTRSDRLLVQHDGALDGMLTRRDLTRFMEVRSLAYRE